MNKLATISLVVFLQAVHIAQAASGEKDSDKPDDSRPARFAGTGGAGGAGYSKDQRALYSAAMEGNREKVRELLAAGVDSVVVLRQIEDTGNVGAINILRTESTNVGNMLLIDVKDRFLAEEAKNPNVLHRAVLDGDPDVVSGLLIIGEDVNAKNAEGDTALHMAAFRGHTAVVSTLLTAGAIVDARNVEGITALYVAAFKGHAAVVSTLLTAGADGVAALCLAAEKGDGKAVDILIAAGVPVNGSNPKEHTVLHHAAFKGHVVVVSTLLTAGATVNRKNAWGDTALCTSVLGAVLGTADYRKHAAVVAALIAAGEKVDEKNAKGETALCIAIAKGQYAIVNALLAGGANVNTVRTDGRTHLGSVINLLETTEDEEKFATALCIMSSLLRAGADVNVIDDDGNTPLINIMRIRDSGYLSSALPQLLEVAGAKLSPSINHTNRYGQTALTMALEKINDPNIIKRLLAAGADPSLGKLSNLTPLQYAAFLGNTPVANLIMHTLISQGKPLECFADDSFIPMPGKRRVFMHVIAQGGDYAEENIEYLLQTARGLKTLSEKTEKGNLPEQIISNPALKAKMKALREGYEWFQANVRLNIYKDMELLRRLEFIAKYILSQRGKAATGFTEMEYSKAERILKAYEAAQKTESLRILIVDGQTKLEEMFNVLNAKKPSDDRIGRAISALKEVLDRINEAVRAGVRHDLLSDFYSSLETLRGRSNSKVDASIKWEDVPFASKEDGKAAAGGAGGGGGGGAAAAAAASKPEERFDFATADLDVETLEALSTATGGNKKKLEAILMGLIEKAEAGARALEEPTGLVSEADMRQALKEKYDTVSAEERGSTFDRLEKSALKRYRANLKKTMGYSEVLKRLDYVLNHGVHPKLIWQILRYAREGSLYKLHEAVKGIEGNEAGTYVSGSVHSSLGDGASLAGSVLEDRDRDFPAEEESPEDRMERDDYRKAFTGLEIPVLELPNTLTEAHLATILNLFTRNYGDMDANGRDLYALFKALGERFDVKYDDDTKRTGNLKITDTQAAEALRAARQDPNYATACMDPKHSSADFKGLKRHMGERTLRLLTAAGITQEMVQDRFDAIHAAATAPTPSAAAAAASAFAMPGTGAKPGRGGSKSPSASGAAAAAAASVSSRTSGYSDYASGGGGGGGGGRSRTGGGAAASGGGGGGWNAARGAYTYELPGK